MRAQSQRTLHTFQFGRGFGAVSSLIWIIIKLQQLQVDAYLMANFYRPNGRVLVNLYVAIYAYQSAGVSSHSSKVCMPSGSWAINRFDEV